MTDTTNPVRPTTAPAVTHKSVGITWNPEDVPGPDAALVVGVGDVEFLISRADALWLANALLRHAGTTTVLS